jgi:hypothetical protein
VQELEEKHERLKKKYKQLMGQSNEMKRLMGIAKSTEQLNNLPFGESGESRRGVETERKDEKLSKLEVDTKNVKNQTHKFGQYGSALANLKTP